MKKLLYMVAGIIATTFITTTTSCKFAPDQNDGDTVAASEFYPEDTAALHAKKVAKTAAQKAIVDSVACTTSEVVRPRTTSNSSPTLLAVTP